MSGRNIEPIPNRKIVQTWRVETWPSGVYSIVRIELTATRTGIRVVLDQAGFPPADGGGGTILGSADIDAPADHVFRALTTKEVERWWGHAEFYRQTGLASVDETPAGVRHPIPWTPRLRFRVCCSCLRFWQHH